jgi:hypothetical protein
MGINEVANHKQFRRNGIGVFEDTVMVFTWNFYGEL